MTAFFLSFFFSEKAERDTLRFSLYWGKVAAEMVTKTADDLFLASVNSCSSQGRTKSLSFLRQKCGIGKKIPFRYHQISVPIYPFL